MVASLGKVKYKSPLRWSGGKAKVAHIIARHFPKHVDTFIEPFVGGGSVYLHARQMNLADNYWINDKHKQLIYFWQCVQDQNTCDQLVKTLGRLHRSFVSVEEIKAYFLKAKKEQPTESFRAALLLFFLNRVAFSGNLTGGFSGDAAVKRFTQSSIERLKLMPAALAGTLITNLDYEYVLAEPASKGDDVLYFIDCPYVKAAKIYDHQEMDHRRLAQLLKETPFKFVATYDDVPEIRRLYKFANIEPLNFSYGMTNVGGVSTRTGKELIIKNF